ncbi:MAG TPA: type VI secretion system-associated protein TagF [Cellvibrio sp.]|nr:type VI secretion system-associated protein TagF [Cellvibrio sp.]
MIRANDVGLFGKLPAHGDFIYRDLPSHFINAWDAWLQGFVASSQQQLGEAWLDIYLTSPIWRFVMSDGVIDGQGWAGIVLPSVDRVGRYFPFSIITKVPVAANPFISIQQDSWFDAMEEQALSALSGNIQLEELVQNINRQSLELSGLLQRNALASESAGFLVEFTNEAPALEQAYPHLLDSHCRQIYSNYSVWSTAMGSERINPCLFHTRGLPNFRSAAAMLDGQWAHWGWHQPVQALP